MAKRSAGGEEMNVLSGYLAEVSPIKDPKHGTQKYFESKIQTSPCQWTQMRVFAPDLWQTFSKSEIDGTPVKLQKFQRKGAATGGHDMIFANRKTIVESLPSLPFQLRRSLFNKPTPVIKLGDLKETTAARVSVIGKILDSGVERDTKQYKVREARIADETGVATLTIWGSNEVLSGKVYLFTELAVREFAGNKKLTTSPDTAIEAKTVHINTHQFELERLKEVDIVGIKVEEAIKCLACNKKIDDVVKSCKFTRCNHCETKSLTENLGKNMWVKVTMTGDHIRDKRTVTVFSDVLFEVLKKHDVLTDNWDDIEDFFLEKKCFLVEEDCSILRKIMVMKTTSETSTREESTTGGAETTTGGAETTTGGAETTTGGAETTTGGAETTTGGAETTTGGAGTLVDSPSDIAMFELEDLEEESLLMDEVDGPKEI